MAQGRDNAQIAASPRLDRKDGPQLHHQRFRQARSREPHPIFAAMLSVVVLGDAIATYHVEEAVLVFAGIALGQPSLRRTRSLSA
jgi:hypothetical protein